MSEEAVRTGSDGRLFGVFLNAGGTARAPVVLMFNAGFVHRVGPFRLWVDLARELGAKGISSFRFDLHGLGDSPAPVKEAHDSASQAVSDLKDAMDFVESRLGPREFIVVGLCSGADYGHPAAKADPRIRGLVMIDAYGYKTPAYFLHRFVKRASNFRRWRNFLGRRLASAAAEAADGDAESRLRLDEVREFPPAPLIQSDILAFLSEGRRLLYVYTGGVPEYFNHERQFWDMFPALNRAMPGLGYRYFPTTDHTFALVEDRRELLSLLCGFALAQGASEARDRARGPTQTEALTG